MFLSGMLVMAYNTYRTIAGGKTEDGLIPVAAAHHA
jgi:cbb3-type cytochrome oxidase subunit 1